MKYWAYINEEVSQEPYTEQELQKVTGFGPDMLICSETSAVSPEPDWKPVRELLPHLVRPKAPNFSKFRPKPPVKNDDNDKKQEQNTSARDPELETLLDDIEEEKTFISEPQNDQEDDVLEVPFDNDFEIPFDTNKSNEEIAREAEAMLAKPNSTEIEEYNADDQHTELIDYASDMQKILEDTIRKSNLHESRPKGEMNDAPKTRTFIAEDLISKTMFNLSEDTSKKGIKKPIKKEEKKDSKTVVPEQKNSKKNSRKIRKQWNQMLNL